MGTQARAKGHFRFVTSQPKTNESAPSTSTSADLLSNQSKFGPVEFNPYRQAYVNANLHPHHLAVLPVQQTQNCRGKNFPQHLHPNHIREKTPPSVAALQCYSSKSRNAKLKKKFILYIFIYIYINIYNMASFWECV